MKKRSLIVATAMLLVAILASTGATYAWFTRSNQASINSITMGVDTASGLAISVTGGSEKVSNLTQTDWDAFDETYSSFPTSLTDVSTTATTLANGTFFKPAKVTADYVASEFATSSSYAMFKFNLWNLSTSEQTVKVTGSITSADGINTCDIARVGLVGGANTTILDNAGATTESIGDTAGTETSTTATNITAGSSFVTIPENGNVEITGYIWVEGTDADCTNANITFGDFNVILNFAGSGN